MYRPGQQHDRIFFPQRQTLSRTSAVYDLTRIVILFEKRYALLWSFKGIIVLVRNLVGGISCFFEARCNISKSI